MLSSTLHQQFSRGCEVWETVSRASVLACGLTVLVSLPTGLLLELTGQAANLIRTVELQRLARGLFKIMTYLCTTARRSHVKINNA